MQSAMIENTRLPANRPMEYLLRYTELNLKNFQKP